MERAAWKLHADSGRAAFAERQALRWSDVRDVRDVRDVQESAS